VGGDRSGWVPTTGVLSIILIKTEEKTYKFNINLSEQAVRDTTHAVVLTRLPNTVGILSHHGIPRSRASAHPEGESHDKERKPNGESYENGLDIPSISSAFLFV